MILCGDLTGADTETIAAQVYLGRWHSSEVAIKCLNPSLFFSGSDGSASKAAMADLMREADLLASLRHPNVVWVYGVVLPKMVRFPSCSGLLRGISCRLKWPRPLADLAPFLVLSAGQLNASRFCIWRGKHRKCGQACHRRLNL